MEESNGDDAGYSNGREPRNAASPPLSSPANVAPKTEPIYKIYLGNLAQSITEADLRNVFERYGRIVNVELRTGFGFVEYSSPSECEAALQGENGKELFGNVVKVEHAQSRTSKVAMLSSSACYKCGLDGHWARECPNVQTKARPRRPLSPRRSISPRARGYPVLSPPPVPHDYSDARGRPAYDSRDKYYAPPPRDYREREPPRHSRHQEPPPVSARDYREPPYYPEDRYGERYARDYPPAPASAAPRFEREYSREPPLPPPRTSREQPREPVRDYRDPRDDYRERDYYYRRPPPAVTAPALVPALGPLLASDRYRYGGHRSPPPVPVYDRQAPPPDRYSDRERDRRYADYPHPGPPPPGRYRSASPPPPPRRGGSGPPPPRSPSPEYRGRQYR